MEFDGIIGDFDADAELTIPKDLPLKWNFDKVVGKVTDVWIEESDGRQIVKCRARFDQEAVAKIPELKERLDLLASHKAMSASIREDRCGRLRINIWLVDLPDLIDINDEK